MPKTLSASEVADFRDRLCDVAARLFAEKGSEGFTMRDLAAELGVSAMTPYRYFPDKEHILAAVRARAFSQFSDALEKAVAASGGGPGQANNAGEAYIRFALENPSSYKLMFELSQPDAEFPELAEAGARARKTLTRHIYPLVEKGILHGDPEVIARVFWAQLHGLIMLHLAGKLGPKVNLRTLATEGSRALGIGFSRPR